MADTFEYELLPDEWPEVIAINPASYEEYGRVSEAVGELTSAILDCKLKDLLDPRIAKQLRGFMEGILTTLKDG